MTIIAPYRSQAPARHSGFRQLLHAEWTKFRTVRGWIIGIILVPLLTVLLGALTASGNQCGIGPGPGLPVELACTAPIGPGGETVLDQFYFVHQPLAGNGSITARMTSLTSVALQPWAKAGIIIKASTAQGSAYAAMMVTGGHGVRMQYDYTQDIAGLPGTVSAAAPRWLRLTRSGDTVTGYDSVDGTHWTEVGTATLTGLPARVQAGLFATSPQAPGAGHIEAGTSTTATGTFDDLSWPSAASPTGTDIGAQPLQGDLGGFQQSGGEFTVTGHGDIAPSVPGGQGDGTPISQTLDGAFGGLIAAIVVAAMFFTAEYRRGLIRTTLAARPARGQVLAAKAVVIGAVTFVAALIGCAIAVPVADHLLRGNGNVIDPVPVLTWLRVVIGTAAVFALAAVLALGLGAIFRHGATAVTAAIVLVILPYIMAIASPALPAAAADWLLRISPTAALAIQQTIPQYPQVASTYMPFFGFFPLPSWAGFAVLVAWTAAILLLAARLLRRRDA